MEHQSALELIHPTKWKCQAGGKFKTSWRLPEGITASTNKGDQYAYCKLCNRDFSVAHGGFNDVTWHIKGPVHHIEGGITEMTPKILKWHHRITELQN
jgi:hypothetical protein